MNYKSGVAGENLPNYSVCVRDGNIILPIKYKTDLNGNLVLVDNIIPYTCKDDEEYIIPKGTEIRYVDIAIVPKLNL
jgi:hypothetical protein